MAQTEYTKIFIDRNKKKLCLESPARSEDVYQNPEKYGYQAFEQDDTFIATMALVSPETPGLGSGLWLFDTISQTHYGIFLRDLIRAFDACKSFHMSGTWGFLKTGRRQTVYLKETLRTHQPEVLAEYRDLIVRRAKGEKITVPENDPVFTEMVALARDLRGIYRKQSTVEDVGPPVREYCDTLGKL